eukprot:4317753-Prorocentrum_lima.AAC.1
MVFLTEAQGSVNAGLVRGRVAASLARLTQSLFTPDKLRFHVYVDDPCITTVGDQARWDLNFVGLGRIG